MKTASVYKLLQIGLGIGAVVIVCAVWLHTACNKSHFGLCWGIRELDFVINRYQTLITGLFAAITIFYLHKQIDEEAKARKDAVNGKTLSYELKLMNEYLDPMDKAMDGIARLANDSTDDFILSNYEAKKGVLLHTEIPDWVLDYELLSVVGRKNSELIKLIASTISESEKFAHKMAMTPKIPLLKQTYLDYMERRALIANYLKMLSHNESPNSYV